MPAAIRLEISAPNAEIILNKPEKRNALSIDMWAEIPGFVRAVEADTSVKVLLIHGGDAGAFAAGADISEFESIYATRSAALASGQVIADALSALENCTKPVIAAIDGACVGGGVSLAMSADLRVASAASKFGVTPAKLGIVYPAGDTRRLLAVAGPSRTKDILFTGRIFPAEEAHQMGLIDRLVPDGGALQAARQLADEIGAVSQWSTRAIKQMIKGLQSGWADDSEHATDLFADGFSNADFADGFRAFLEKRPAKFTL